MRRIKLTVAYDGTNYSGWQSQNNADTIEDRVNEALSGLLADCHDPHEFEGVIGASRTDAGVHAEGNVAVFDTEAQMAGDRFAYALNARLPEDIRILRSEEVASDFHPRYTSSHKTYEYQILNTTIPIPTYTRYMYHIYEDIDINAMIEAVDFIIGEHDFSAFCSAGAQVQSKVRTVTALTVTEEPLEDLTARDLPADISGSEPAADETGAHTFPPRIIRIRVTGTGFLYNMVRIIAGTLIEVGLGRRSLESVRQAIATGDRQLAGPTAPACGLTLKQILYTN